jgi:DNA modification methylase
VKPMVEIAGARVFLGDCRDVLKTLPDNSVDSVVTDPPYELGFMGKKWDSSGIAYDVTVWEECLRVLKPGGHVLAFGGSRTWHRLAVAVEDAGFELRDSIAWLYGSGFPKSLDVSKAIDKNLGAEREVISEKPAYGIGSNGAAFNGHSEGAIARETLPATSEAKKWQGWGTALKPAFEPVVVGRKPLVGTVAENVLEWGVGGLNIDGSRIGSENSKINTYQKRDPFGDSQVGNEYESKTVQGRWPANVILDEVTAGLLDEQSGVLKSGANKPYVSNHDPSQSVASMIQGNKPGETLRTYTAPASEGGASRFFYVAKASKRDRNEGLEALLENDSMKWSGGNEGQGVGAFYPDGTPRPSQKSQNFHPTVKPTQLMRYLIKLVTPPGGTVLDPFTGSGSTGKAALLDGFEFVGAELTEEYLPIIEGRLRWASEQVEDEDVTLF